MAKTYCLSNSDISSAKEIAEAFFRNRKVESKEVLRLGLMLEEILLQAQEHFGKEHTFFLKTERRLGHSLLVVQLPGDSYNPLASESEELNLLHRLQHGSSSSIQWGYANGFNNIILHSPRKMKLSFPAITLLSVLLAVIAGLICRTFDGALQTQFLERFVSPTLGTLMGVITAVSGPMIFFSLVWGICTIGDTGTLSSIGKKMLSRFMLHLLLVATLSATFCFPFFRGADGSKMAFDFSEFYKMLLGIIPNNMIEPFISGNTQQIIFLAVLFGIVLLILGDRVSTVTALVDHITIMVQTIMTLANKLIPIIVFLSIFKIMLNGQLSSGPQTYKIIPVYIGLSLLIVLIYTIIVTVRQKVNPLVLMKKSAPATLLALTTASSPAVLATNLDICEKDFGIEKKIVHFGVPLGQTIFKPGSLSRFVAVSFCVAELYGVSITPNWFILVVITCFLMGVSSPPVAGGAVVCYTVLFRQLGIPEEALGFALAINVLFDFILTAVNIYCLQMELIGLSGRLNMLDCNKLRKT